MIFYFSYILRFIITATSNNSKTIFNQFTIYWFGNNHQGQQTNYITSFRTFWTFRTTAIMTAAIMTAEAVWTRLQSGQKNKAPKYFYLEASLLKRRLPTLPLLRSTIGVTKLNFSVRNGKRWNLRAIVTLMSLYMSD